MAQCLNISNLGDDIYRLILTHRRSGNDLVPLKSSFVENLMQIASEGAGERLGYLAPDNFFETNSRFYPKKGNYDQWAGDENQVPERFLDPDRIDSITKARMNFVWFYFNPDKDWAGDERIYTTACDGWFNLLRWLKYGIDPSFCEERLNQFQEIVKKELELKYRGFVIDPRLNSLLKQVAPRYKNAVADLEKMEMDMGMAQKYKFQLKILQQQVNFWRKIAAQ